MVVLPDLCDYENTFSQSMSQNVLFWGTHFAQLCLLKNRRREIRTPDMIELNFSHSHSNFQFGKYLTDIISARDFFYLTVSVSHSVESDSATPWTVARQAPPPMGFSRQEHWSRLPCAPPGIFSTQEWNQWPALQAASLPAELPGEPDGKPRQCIKKQRHHFANKGPYSQSYGFCSSHVWM